jgi:hypothetical protein
MEVLFKMNIIINILSALIIYSILKDAWNYNGIKSAARKRKEKRNLYKRLNIKEIKRG